MKLKRKILELMVFIFFSSMSITAYAEENRFVDAEYEKYELVESSLRNSAIHNHKNGQDSVWGIASFRNNSAITMFYANNITDNIVTESLNNSNFDFVQIGQLISIDEIDSVKDAFEEDPLKAAIFSIMPMRIAEMEAKYEQLSSKPIAVYYKISEYDNSDVFALEIAIGRYVVKKGDTLYSIAKRHGTTVQDLLRINPDISDPNRIWIGQNITIK